MQSLLGRLGKGWSLAVASAVKNTEVESRGGDFLKFYQFTHAVNPNVGRGNIDFPPRERLQPASIFHSLLCLEGFTEEIYSPFERRLFSGGEMSECAREQGREKSCLGALQGRSHKEQKGPNRPPPLPLR